MEINIKVDGEGIKEKVSKISLKTKVIIGIILLVLIAIPIFNSTYNSDENQAKREAEKAVTMEVEAMGEDGFKYKAERAEKIDKQDSLNEVKYYVYGTATESNGATYELRVKMFHYIEEGVWQEGGITRTGN